MQNQVLIICGPTASGKSGLAVELAKRLNTEIISADSMSIYKQLNIGTAKPNEAERQGIMHHMIDVAEPEDNFSVSDYEAMATPIIQELLKRGKTPIICGGTGFYIDALLYKKTFGKAAASPQVREKYTAYLNEFGADKLHELLLQKDPASAEKLHKNDTKRVVRALEIIECTGEKKSAQRDDKISRFLYTAICIDHPREHLYARINDRVDKMLESGLVNEVEGLIKRGLTLYNQCMQAIGYKECYQYLKNEINHSTMSDIIKKTSRNYAKRQITYFKMLDNLVYLKAASLQDLANQTELIFKRSN